MGPVYIEPKDDPGAYDREVFLVVESGDMAMDVLAGTATRALQQMANSVHSEAPEKTKGFEVRAFSAQIESGRIPKELSMSESSALIRFGGNNAKPYSYGLRVRVIETIEAGASWREAAERYGISASVVVIWMRLERDRTNFGETEWRQCLSAGGARGSSVWPRL